MRSLRHTMPFAIALAFAPAVTTEAAVLNVTRNLVTRYEPGQAGGVTVDASNRISSLTDFAPDATVQNATQATPANQPLFVANAINGNGVVKYDTTTTFLNGALPTQPAASDGFTYFLVLQPQSGVTNGLVTDGAGTYFLDRTAATNELVSLKAVGGKYGLQKRYNDGSGLGGPVSTTDIATNATQIVAIRRTFDGAGVGNADSFDLFVNGALQGSVADTGGALTLPTPLYNQHQGPSGQGMVGLMGTTLIYNSTLSNAEVAQVESYLEATYAVPEPSVLALTGFAAMAGLVRRRPCSAGAPGASV